MPRDRRFFSKTKSRFKKTWNRVVDGLGRRIVVYLPDLESECPNCYYDKVNRRSSGICTAAPTSPNYFTVGRCSVCLGKGVLTVSRRRCIDGIVIWNPSGSGMNGLTFTESGFEGATKVEIKTDECHLDLIKQCKCVVIDGIRCKLSNPPIFRGIGEQHLLVAQFFTEKKPIQDSGESLN